MAVIISLVLIFVGIVFLVLLHIFFSEWFSRRGNRRGSMDERGTTNGGNRSISKIDLEKLPCYDYVAAKDNTSSPVDCAVCLENLTTGDKCRLLPICKHSFHAQCVDTWLLKTPICPICRSSAGSHSVNQVVIGNNVNVNSMSRESQTTTGNQPGDNGVVLLRESLESGPSRNAGNGIELRENQTLGSPSSGHREVE